jgi:hypothetical protein
MLFSKKTVRHLVFMVGYGLVLAGSQGCQSGDSAKTEEVVEPSTEPSAAKSEEVKTDAPGEEAVDMEKNEKPGKKEKGKQKGKKDKKKKKK